MMKNNINSNKYVVLDVETNGLSAHENDLLSISIYDPYTKEEYTRYLPLELNDCVFTSNINGISEDILKDLEPLSQQEVNNLIAHFNLDNRTILTYGSLDEKFIRIYFIRHKITGFDKLTFDNMKHRIISSKFQENNITKDNMCIMFGIENVTVIHSGINDCKLEWELYKKICNKYLLVNGCSVYELNDKYIIPISYLEQYSNFKYFRKIPDVYIKTKVIKEIVIDKRKIQKFETNITGISIEHLMNTMLNVNKIDSRAFEIKNRRQLNYIGSLPSQIHEIPVLFTNDGKIKAIRNEDKKFVESVNKTTEQFRREIIPVIDYINNNIFNNECIYSQELVINEQDNIMCKCDLSNENAILEIKTGTNLDIEKHKMQLYYESNNRETYILQIDWHHPKNLKFIITKVFFINKEEYEEIKQQEKIKKSTNSFQNKIRNKDIRVIEYINSSKPLKVQCKKCGYTWSTYRNILLNNQFCINCNPNIINEVQKEIVIKESTKKDYGKEFTKKVFEKSNRTIAVLKYYGSKSKLEVGCLQCGYKWKIRADHLLSRCYCPNCKKGKKI